MLTKHKKGKTGNLGLEKSPRSGQKWGNHLPLRFRFKSSSPENSAKAPGHSALHRLQHNRAIFSQLLKPGAGGVSPLARLGIRYRTYEMRYLGGEFCVDNGVVGL